MTKLSFWLRTPHANHATWYPVTLSKPLYLPLDIVDDDTLAGHLRRRIPHFVAAGIVAAFW